jgi:hypothetical protein
VSTFSDVSCGTNDITEEAAAPTIVLTSAEKALSLLLES